MNKALISINEPRNTGYRVAQVVISGEEFPVGEGLYWLDCGDNIVADLFWLDTIDSTFKDYIPPRVPQVKSLATQPQPTAQGVTTF